MTVLLLKTPVKLPDEDDWGKLKMVLNYLKSTNYMKLTLRFESVVVVKWWIGSSYNTHKDSRVHAGGIMSLG